MPKEIKLYRNFYRIYNMIKLKNIYLHKNFSSYSYF